MALANIKRNLKRFSILVTVIIIVSLAYVGNLRKYFYAVERRYTELVFLGQSNDLSQRKATRYFHSYGQNSSGFSTMNASLTSDERRTFGQLGKKETSPESLQPNSTVTNISETIAYNHGVKVGDIYGTGCPPNPYRGLLKQLLMFWVNLSNLHNINYFLCAGSLLGSVRNSDIVPYDRDIDLCISHKEFFKLQKVGSQKPFNYKSRKHIHIALLEDTSEPMNGRIRLDCKGRQVTYMKDPCSFTSPWARLIFRRRYLDVFVYHESELHLNDRGFKTLHLTKDIFPVKPCRLLGIPTKCPRKPKVFLSRYYGPNSITTPHYVCRNGSWVPTSPDASKKFQIRFPSLN